MESVSADLNFASGLICLFALGHLGEPTLLPPPMLFSGLLDLRSCGENLSQSEVLNTSMLKTPPIPGWVPVHGTLDPPLADVGAVSLHDE